MDVDLLITNGNVATLAGPAGPRPAEAADDVGLVADGAVAVKDGRIAWVGPAAEWDGAAARTVDAQGGLVTPGFVDSHDHLVYAGDRAFELGLKLAGKSYMEILAAGGGIAYTTGQTRAASVEGLVDETWPRLRRMLAAGTTTTETKTGYALDLPGELRMLEAARRLEEGSGMTMAHTFLGAHAVPKEYEGRTDAYVDHVVADMLPAVADQGIATFCDAFVEEGVFTYEHGEAIFAAAKGHGMGLRLHADEIVNTKGAELAAAAGAVSADHLLRVSEEGIAAMADTGTIATLLPTVPLTLFAPEWPSGKAFLEAGVPVALATDHNPNNPVTNLGLVAQLGCYLLGLTPAQALTGVTWNAAAGLGLEGEVGSIEVGKRADLLVHDVPGLDQWIQEPGRMTASQVYLAGVPT
ncbi:MAG: imidazolonepropionase [Thermoplasmatota archaeon]